MRSRVVLVAVASVACYPTTTRPSFTPLPSAALTEVGLAVPEATRQVALALDGNSIPVRRTEPKDGWLETDWFDAATLRPTSKRRLGDGVVKVRAWIDPSRPNHSNVTIETVYRPLADPSRDDRSLERLVPSTNPVAMRVAGVLNVLVKQFGEPVDTTKGKAKPDSLGKAPPQRAVRDTTR